MPTQRAIFVFLILFCTFLTSVCAQPPESGVGSDATTNKAAPIPLPPPSASARDLFSRYKSRLVQVRVLLNSANEQSSLGSGFVVRDDGPKGVWLITNYHVVSSLAINPEKFRLELRPTSERAVKATLVAVDVIHDLAVLRTEPLTGAAACGCAAPMATPPRSKGVVRTIVVFVRPIPGTALSRERNSSRCAVERVRTLSTNDSSPATL